MTRAKLGSLVSITGGGTPDRSNASFWGGSIPWVTVKDLKSLTISGALERITAEGLEGSATNLIQPGAIIVPTRMALGKAAINTTAIAINQDLKALRVIDSQRVDRDYLFRFLLSKSSFLESQGKGATVKGITLDVLRDLDVPLPAKSEQERIASLLNKAEGLCRKRQKAIRLADELLRAAFYESCGDPVTNSLSWPEQLVSEIGTITTGNTPSRDVDAYFGDAIEWIKSDNINTPSHVLTKSREGLSERGASVGRIVPAGSILMTCIAGSPSVIGNVALADRRVAFNQQINAITPRPGVESDFLYTLLLFSKPRIQAASTNSMKGMVSKGALEKVRLIWPAVHVQHNVAALFRRIRTLTERMESADPLPLLAALQDKLFTSNVGHDRIETNAISPR